MAAQRPSIKKLATDWIVVRLSGNGDLPVPSGLPTFKVDKDRRSIAIPKAVDALLSVYALRQNEPVITGMLRRPVQKTRNHQIEVRVLLQGDDDAMDGFEQWIDWCMGSAGQIVTADYPDGLVLSVREAESASNLLQNSEGDVLVYQSRWTLEYTTLPDDLTYTGRVQGDAESSREDRA